MFHVFLFINFTLCLIAGNMTSLCNQRRLKRESRAESRGRQTTLSFPLSLQVMLLQLAHVHSLCLKFGACARHALVKPLCGGIHYVCVLAWVKGFGRNHDDFINSYSSFVQRCQHAFILQYHIYIFCSRLPALVFVQCNSECILYNKGSVNCEQSSLFCQDADGVNSQLGITSCYTVTQLKQGVPCIHTCTTLCPSDSELLIEHTHKHTRTLLTLPSQLCRSELLFVCVGSCIYIRGLCQPPHRFPPFSNEKQKGQKLLSC